MDFNGFRYCYYGKNCFFFFLLLSLSEVFVCNRRVVASAALCTHIGPALLKTLIADVSILECGVAEERIYNIYIDQYTVE